VGADAERDLLNRKQRAAHVVAEIGLGQYEHWHRPTLPAKRQVALEPAQVQVAVQGAHDEDRVEVRSQHLLLGRRPRRLAGERRPPRQHSLDRLVVKRDPIAHGGQLGSGGRLVTQSGR
jgi:hypothetical protein